MQHMFALFHETGVFIWRKELVWAYFFSLNKNSLRIFEGRRRKLNMNK